MESAAVSTPLRRHRSDEAERALRDAQQVAADAVAEAVRLRRALDALTSAIVIHDARGQLVLRNRQHAELDANRHVSALVAAAVEQLVDAAREGEAAAQTLESTAPRPAPSTSPPSPSARPRRPWAPPRWWRTSPSAGGWRRSAAISRPTSATSCERPSGRSVCWRGRWSTRTTRSRPSPGPAHHDRGRESRTADRRPPRPVAARGRRRPRGDRRRPGHVVTTAAERVAAPAAQREVKVLALPPVPGTTVVGDERQRVSALVNLLDNAIKYSEPGSIVELEADSDRDWVVITVRDQGIGIPSKDLERIFHASTGSTGPAAGRRAAPGWACRSSSMSPPTTGAGSRSLPGRERAPRSPCACQGLNKLSADDGRQPPRRPGRGGRGVLRRGAHPGPDPEGFCGPDRPRRGRSARTFDGFRPDVVLLDLMLPRVSGIDVCRHIRARSSIPIIMVTAKDWEFDAVVGLEVGADDYVTKPYRLRELVARVRAVLRRAGPEPEPDDVSVEVLEVGDVALDAERHRVTVRGSEVALPLREFELLELLLDNAGRVLTRDTLIDRIWGPNYVGDTKTLDVHVKRLRSKIEDDPAKPSRITTIRGPRLPLREAGPGLSDGRPAARRRGRGSAPPSAGPRRGIVTLTDLRRRAWNALRSSGCGGRGGWTVRMNSRRPHGSRCTA